MRGKLTKKYTLSSLAFKKVTRGSAIKMHFPFPLLPQVLVGVAVRQEQSNNLGNLGRGIRSPHVTIVSSILMTNYCSYFMITCINYITILPFINIKAFLLRILDEINYY